MYQSPTALDLVGFDNIDPNILARAATNDLTNGYGGYSYASGAPNLTASIGGTGSSGKFGLNMPTINLGINALGTLGGLYTGLKQLSLANKAFSTQKEFAEANLSNQIKSYNTALADRARSRAAVEGQSDSQMQSYIDQNKLTR